MSERLGDYDADAIRSRLAEDDGSDAPVSVKDVAEATGLPIEEVQAHIDRLRAERAFASSTVKPSRKGWIAAGCMAIIVAVAGFYTWTFTASQEQPRAISRNKPRSSSFGAFNPRSSSIASMRDVMLTFGPGVPPPGIIAQVSGQVYSLTGDAHVIGNVSHHPLSYSAQRSVLASSLRYLAWRLSTAEDPSILAPAGTKYMDSNANTFEPQAGKAHYSIGGDCKAVDGFAAVTKLHSAGVQKIVDAALAGHEGDKGSADEVLPPPGMFVMALGKQQLSLAGPYDGTVTRSSAVTLARSIRCMTCWDSENLPLKESHRVGISVYFENGEVDFLVPVGPDGKPTSAGSALIDAKAREAVSKLVR
jgi:hypothetical protein